MTGGVRGEVASGCLVVPRPDFQEDRPGGGRSRAGRCVHEVQLLVDIAPEDRGAGTDEIEMLGRGIQEGSPDQEGLQLVTRLLGKKGQGIEYPGAGLGTGTQAEAPGGLVLPG